VGAKIGCCARRTRVHARQVSVNPCSSTIGGPEPPRRASVAGGVT
jgi:hypothetical protein